MVCLVKPSKQAAMSIPLNPSVSEQPTNHHPRRGASWIDSFARPNQFNQHAWQTTKRLALLVWKCHLEQRAFHRTLNFLHPTFYEMIKTPQA